MVWMLTLAALVGLSVVAMYQMARLEPITKLALAGHALLWTILPLTLRTVLESDARLSYHDFVLHVAHCGTVAATIGTITLLSLGPRRVPRRRALPWTPRQAMVWSWTLVVLTAVSVIGRQWVWQTAGGSFGDLVSLAISTQPETVVRSNLVGALVTILQGASLATFIEGLRQADRGHALRRAGLLCLLLLSLQTVLYGMRIALLMAVWLVCLWHSYRKNGRRLGTLAIAGAMVAVWMVVAPGLAVALGVVRSQGRLGFREFVVSVTRESQNVGQTPLSQLGEIFALATVQKFDNLGTASNLLQSDGPGFAGLKPILASMVSPIPRLVWPSKPVPISADGQQSGVPYVRAASYYGDIYLGYVVPVSAAAIAVWELGWYVLPLLVAVNVLVILRVDRVIAAGGLVAPSIWISLLGYPGLEFTIAPIASIIRDLLRILLFLFVWRLLLLLLPRWRQSTLVREVNRAGIAGDSIA